MGLAAVRVSVSVSAAELNTSHESSSSLLIAHLIAQLDFAAFAMLAGLAVQP